METTIAERAGVTFETAQGIAQLGVELAAAGRLTEARIVFEGMVAMNPRDAAARAALGTVYQRLGRLDEAVAEYTAAIELDPQQPVALSNRGEVRLRRNDRGGIDDLLAAANADPTGVTVASLRAQALLNALSAVE